MDNIAADKEAVRYLESIRVALEHGRKILLFGGCALEAVEQCASLLEDDPLFNAGTGYGEDFMRTVLGKTVSDLIAFKELNAPEATREAIAYLTRKVQGRGGLILIDTSGRCAKGFTTKKMVHGWIELGGEAVCGF